MANLADAQQPKRGGVLNIADPVGPPVLDPHKDGSYQSSGMVLTIMYEGLLIRDEKGELKPHLAETWKAVSTTVYEFKIRRGVTFHNGREMDAERREVLLRAGDRAEDGLAVPRDLERHRQGGDARQVDGALHAQVSERALSELSGGSLRPSDRAQGSRRAAHRPEPGGGGHGALQAGGIRAGQPSQVRAPRRLLEEGRAVPRRAQCADREG